KEPYKRVSDNNLVVINDLYMLHRIVFLPTQKHDKESQINQLRQLIRECKLIINPKCKVLIDHLKSATWDRNRKGFSRSKDKGHFDAIDALIYFVRNVDISKNPYPKGYSF